MSALPEASSATRVTLSRRRLCGGFGARDRVLAPHERLRAHDLAVTDPVEPMDLALDDRAGRSHHLQGSGHGDHVADLAEGVLRRRRGVGAGEHLLVVVTYAVLADVQPL